MKVWIVLILVAIASTDGGLTQRTAGSFSIDIRAPISDYKAGAPVEIKIVLTNTSSQSQWIYQDVAGEFDYTIQVLDQKKSEPSETRYFQAVKGKDSGNPAMVVEHGGGPRLVKADGTLTDIIDLNKLYNLLPGKYTVQVERLDSDSKATVKSNTVTINVTP